MKKNNVIENIDVEEVLPLKQQEIDLIYILRNKYQYGSIEIIMRDGVPYDILRTVERVRLGNLSTDKVDSMN